MISISPSLSISATKIHLAPSALVATFVIVKLGSGAPSFSYQSILSLLADAVTISISPSPSISAAKIEYKKPLTASLISCFIKSGFAAPLFSYQEILLS